MPMLRQLARPMLASMFIAGGIDALRNPARLVPDAERFPALADNPERAVRIAGAVQVTAGALLATGRQPRPAALALAAVLAPLTWARHRFWEADSPEQRQEQLIHFLKNMSMMGGLLIAAADTAARPSLAWRGRHAVHTARHDVALAARTAKATARPAAAAGRLQGKLVC
ncbi:DoxX family protein [Peterkaempfera bronchialis]|uniref:DoxX family protein n=1 Tax=Peterkaempfera bronchialis TaxID=2126346 RepID=A0A345SUG8_9ACTN|nr:DoxX family protein [Peterkaempfera bronchialis]AXI77373.1 DoxX family protein [Peterkaempfera bronchialis]